MMAPRFGRVERQAEQLESVRVRWYNLRMRKPFLERLAKGPILFDGATGTELYKRGVFINRNFEATCLSDPKLVESIHRDYIDAGAECVLTNTFGANRVKLHLAGLDEKVDEINRAAVSIARSAAGDSVYVGGAVGPSGLTPSVIDPEQWTQVSEAFKEQIRVLAEGGVDVICLETFTHLEEIKVALAAAKEVAPDLPVMAQMAFTGDGTTADGTTPDSVVDQLHEEGADVVGANCAEGPAKLYPVAEAMVGRGVPIAIQPNAGYPKRIGERYLYMATPEYFAVYTMRFYKLGVSIVGGCCGTGPEHIRQMGGSRRMTGGGRIQVESAEHIAVGEHPDGVEPWAMVEKSALGRRLARGKDFVVSVEINPPVGLDPSSAISKARMLKAAGIDVVNIPDNARASVRMSNSSLASRIQAEVGMETIVHVCCRDRNFLAMQSELLGYHVMGLNNLVIITGDPPKVGDYPDATAVFDLDSVGLLRVVNQFNRGLDPAGKSVKGATRFLLACGVEPAATDYEREMKRLEQKRDAGAEFIMTQPVYDPAVIDRFLDDSAYLDMPVLVGLLPLASYRNAEFLHNEVPGMSVPKTIRDRMEAVGKGVAARAEGVKIAQEALEAVKDRISGVYIMPPFGRVEAAIEILEVAGYERPTAWRDNWRE